MKTAKTVFFRLVFAAAIIVAFVSIQTATSLNQQVASLNQQIHTLETTMIEKDAEILSLGSEVDFLHNLIIWGGVGAGLLIIFLFGCVLILKRGLKQATQIREETEQIDQTEILRRVA